MKPNLDLISKRLCNVACAALVISLLIPEDAGWLTGFAAVTAIAGLSLMFAHEISARKQSEQAAKPAVVTH